MTYDELIKRLRTMADWVGIMFLDDSENVRTNLFEAADAIEELQAEINGWIEQERDFLLRSVPRWISVAERLPEVDEDVFLMFPNNQAAGFRDLDGCWGVYSGDGFYTKVEEHEIKPTHWAKKIPEPPKEK